MMSSSYLTESEAPRDFRVSSTESDGHYTKCLLCYTVKRNFYCVECIRTGNFIHSSMPYSDRYSEKQAKLHRVKANKKYILDRCEKLLQPKLKKDRLITEAKQSRDRLDLIRLAIEQRRSNIEEKRQQLKDLVHYNNELRLKLPRYQKRVAALGKHVQQQCMELQNKVSTYNDKTEALAALRRSRIRQLTTYIFPVYMTYDTSDSIEDMEFIGSEPEEEPPRRPQLHIVAPSLCTRGDFAHLHDWLREHKESASGACNPWHRGVGALSLAAQLLVLLSWTLHQRLPHALTLAEFSNWRMCVGVVRARLSRVCACAACLLAPHMAALPLAHAACPAAAHCRLPAHVPATAECEVHPLVALHSLTVAAATDHPELGRPACGAARWAGWAARWADADDADNEPEHLSWPDHEEVVPCEPVPVAAPAPSLVTSLASMWRGWTK